ncbi:MAG: winged helix-turn-helix domain-containing protein [Acidobacteria bacterium]|nr:winged helix-turn-helix domain-containing protein [Acidobacteriota bacterium]
MSVLTAVQTILAQAGKPLHYKEITKRVLDQELWTTNGLTPHDTINAQLAVDIIKKGSSSPFQRTGKGMFALRTWGLPEYQVPSSTSNDGAPRSQMSFTDATEAVLETYAGKQPMHYRAITEKALELGLIATAGKTPEATLYAQVITEIQRRVKRGERPRFVQ